MTTDATSDYTKYRGKCKEMVEQLCIGDPFLTPVKGWYHCPIWGAQQHWWCTNVDGNIIDPTVAQFPSKGMGTYEEYKGVVPCEYCGESVKEEDVYAVDQHVYCSYKCYGHDVGF